MAVSRQSKSSKVVVVQLGPDQALIETLRQLLVRAEAGELNGFAYITLEPYGKYSGDVLGAARHLPILALGVVKALENKISGL